MNLYKIVDFISHGGVVSWILIALYLIMCTVALERIVFFTQTYFPQKNITDLIQNPNKNMKKHVRSQVYRIYALKKSLNATSTPRINEKIEREAFSLIEEMRSSLWILSNISHVAPLLGLLGTILGLISSFQIMAVMGADADISVFAGGIWEAMSTTALGLIVAIPALFLYKIFEHIVDRRCGQITRIVSLMSEDDNENI
ncbi:MAG: MotA/TolQ/ExbB proton channel family protein [Brevinema sp.]